ncbi:alpha/beta fold hydrolase [Natronospira sp.]|uniref:alpha/beta fold hydrolase n=1 Tax=Natronospira sp. TaxID=2024970 RepID=UPI00387316CE
MVIGSAIYYPRTFSYRLRTTLRLIFVDVRHFADGDASIGPDEISLDTYMHDIDEVHAHLGHDRVVLVGHSHHGNLALEYAKRYPERVSHLVLIGAPPVDVISTVKAAEAYWEAHASEARKATLRAKLAHFRAEGRGRMTPEQAYVAQYVAEGPRYWHDPTYDASHLWEGVPLNMGAMAIFREFFADGYELWWGREQLAAPVLVMVGEHDYAVPPVLWDDVLRRQKDLRFHLFRNSGHTPQLEEPEEFDRVLLDWLDKSR